jgi:hypothetical protein
MAIRETQTIKPADVKKIQAVAIVGPAQEDEPDDYLQLYEGDRPTEILSGRHIPPKQKTKHWFLLAIFQKTLAREEDTPEEAAARAKTSVVLQYDKDKDQLEKLNKLIHKVQMFNSRNKKSISPDMPGVKILYSYGFDSTGLEKTKVSFWAIREAPPEVPEDGEEQQEEQQPQEEQEQETAPPPPPRPAAVAPRGPQAPVRWNRS